MISHVLKKYSDLGLWPLKINKFIHGSKTYFYNIWSIMETRFIAENEMDRQKDNPKKHNASGPGCRRHRGIKILSHLVASSKVVVVDYKVAVAGGNSLLLHCRDFYKLWKLLWTKPQQYKTTQPSAMLTLYQGKTRSFSLLSSWMSNRLPNNKNKWKITRASWNHFAWKANIDSVLALNCWVKLEEINQKSNVFQTKSKQMFGGCNRNS